MNTRDLHYFLAVAEFEHFGQAAEYCQVSQPTLSGQIKRLEEQLGVVLFERNNRRVMLTEVGRLIALHAKKVLNETDTIREIAEGARDPLAGKFKLAAIPTVATYLFPKIIPKLKKAMPQLKLIVSEDKTEAILDKLRQGVVDAALLALPVYDDFLECQKLFNDEFFLAVPTGHELAKFKTVNIKTLKKCSLLLLDEGHCLRDQALEVCQLHGLSEDLDFKATSLETLRQLVIANVGITLMPKLAIYENEKNIQYLPFSAPKPSRVIALAWRKTTTRKQLIASLIGIAYQS